MFLYSTVFQKYPQTLYYWELNVISCFICFIFDPLSQTPLRLFRKTVPRVVRQCCTTILNCMRQAREPMNILLAVIQPLQNPNRKELCFQLKYKFKSQFNFYGTTFFLHLNFFVCPFLDYKLVVDDGSVVLLHLRLDPRVVQGRLDNHQSINKSINQLVLL